MKPKTHITHTSSSRPTGGIFISAVFPGEIRAGLTIVNKHVLNGSNTINYNGAIFPTVKPVPTTVNKLNEVSSMKPLKTDIMNELNARPYYPIALLSY